MNFMDSMKQTLNGDAYNQSFTENGALGYRSTGKALVDMNFAVASLRSASEKEIADRFCKVFFEDKMAAMKWLFFARDVRGGLGERRLFRAILKYMAENAAEYVEPIIPLVSEYGRWDDLWCLLDTPVANTVMECVTRQLQEDQKNAKQKKKISLLAKWLPRHKSRNSDKRRYANMLCSFMGMNERQYQHVIANLSRYLKVVEIEMSDRKWDEIDYERVPSRANLQYNNAFLRHDEDRRRQFLDSVSRGDAKINAGTLFPHDIVHKYAGVRGVDSTLEALWDALPDTVDGCDNTIVVADGSASMTIRVGNSGVSALDVANSLAIYFAERSSGQFKDRYITFSMRPQLVNLSNGKNLKEKLGIARSHCEVANTNIEAVFELILDTAITNRMDQSELPKNILIISDMEFDSCATTNAYGNYRFVSPTQNLFKAIEQKYCDAGYQIPRMVFWNVNSRTGTIPVKENDLGVALVSGFSPNVVKMVMSGKLDPYECLLEAINVERYQLVEDALRPIIFA